MAGDGTIGAGLYGSEWFAKLAGAALASEWVSQAAVTAIELAFAAKARADRNLQTLLGLLNLPSRADLKKLATRLDAVQGSLVNLNLKVDRLLAAEARRRKRRREAARRDGEPGRTD